MLRDFDYTRSARRFATRFPAVSYVSTQIFFWTVANSLMGLIIHFYSLIIGQTFKIPVQSYLKPVLIFSAILGTIYGTVLGITDYHLDRQYFRKQSLGMTFLLKTVISGALSVVVFGGLTMVSENMDVPSLFPSAAMLATPHPWKYTFLILTIFYTLMTFLLSFINQVNKKYGPGVLVPLVLGKYRSPVEEERIFMFMDLKSSTSIAETLGHINYSAFIRDSFWDINQVLSPFNAEVYQYVGDEIVVSWKTIDDLENHCCIQFFFACQDQFLNRIDYYKDNYGFFPEFKAGLHMGKVTAVEIGDIKRDIAYHGDTINTTARIQSVCNQYNKNFLVSDYLLDRTGLRRHFQTESLGMIQLKGKTVQVGIASIER